MKFQQKNVLIVLKGVQRADGERDVVELSTLGKYYKLENGVDYLTYEESETTGFEGCTHFPLFYDIINACFDYQVTLIDSGQETARFCNRFLAQNHLLKESEDPPVHQFYVTDDPEGFCSNAAMFLGRRIDGNVEQVSVESL